MATVEKTELESFQERVQAARDKFNKIVSWHLEAHTEAGIELPYSGNEVYCYMTVQDAGKWNDETNKYEYNIDVEATLKNLSKVVKFAVKKGCKVEKRYDTDFEVNVTIGENIVIHYIANRDAVCEKKVVGTEVVPARVIPEQVKEIVEWECNKVSLLA